jgi:hypothetical protein
MQAQAYEGYFDKGQFYSAGQLFHIPERRKVFITVLDAPVKEDVVQSNDRLKYLDELERMVKEDTSEKLRPEDFPRMNLRREPILFNDEVQTP